MREEEVDEQFLYFDQQFCFFGEELFKPLVALSENSKTAIENGFNTLTIPVSLLPDSNLSFEKALELALEAKTAGLKIVFDLDLGLFDRMQMPLASNVLFSTLEFAIETLKSTLLDPFSSITLGVIVYKGSADFHQFLKNDFSLFEDLQHISETDNTSILLQAYFETGLQFIEKMAALFPARYPLFVLLDFSQIDDTALKAFMLNRERLGRVLIVPKNTGLCYYGMHFDERVEAPFAFFGTQILEEETNPEKTYGILLPTLANKNLLAYKEIGEAIDYFMEKGIHFRMIPEALFVSEWDAVELLFVPPVLSKEALRMVKGYIASQGELVALGDNSEIFNEWKNK